MDLRSGNIYLNPNDNTYQLRSGNIYFRDVDSDSDVEDVEMVPLQEPDMLSFYDWKKQIEDMVITEFNMYCDDIPDFPYHTCYDEGMEPLQVFNQIRSRFYRDNPYSQQMFQWWQNDIDNEIYNRFSVRLSDFPNIPLYDCFLEQMAPIHIVEYISSQMMEG